MGDGPKTFPLAAGPTGSPKHNVDRSPVMETGGVKMRIGIVIDELDPRRGGWSNGAGNLWCCGRRGYEPHIIAKRFGNTPLPRKLKRISLPAANLACVLPRPLKQVHKMELDLVHDMGAGWTCDIFQPHGGSHTAWLERREDMYPGGFGVSRAGSTRYCRDTETCSAIAKRQFATRRHRE